MWIEFHQSIRDHPKTRKLARRLEIHKAQAVGHLGLLWIWALDYAPDGELARYDAEDIAIGADWDGDSSEFRAALEGAGFIDEDDAGARLHDWHVFAGKLLEARTAGARGNHKRWHVDRGVTDPSCDFCRGDSGATLPPDSGATVGGESTQPTEPNLHNHNRGGVDEKIEKTRAALATDFDAVDLDLALEALKDGEDRVKHPIPWTRDKATRIRDDRLEAERLKETCEHNVPLHTNVPCSACKRQQEEAS